MKYVWKETSGMAWHLFVRPDGVAKAYPPGDAAMAYRYTEGQGWKGIVFSNPQGNAVQFYGVDTLEEIKSLLETTVALRQG